jgi:uncharacterized membrane protein
MEKTKLGIAKTLFAAIVCLLGLYGGYTPMLLVLAYVLLVEEDAGLKKLAVKILTIMLAFSAASTVINLIPDLLNLIYSLLGLFGVNFYLSVVERAFNFLNNVLYLAKTVLLVFLAVISFLGKEFKLPVLDDFLDKYIG